MTPPVVHLVRNLPDSVVWPSNLATRVAVCGPEATRLVALLLASAQVVGVSTQRRFSVRVSGNNLRDHRFDTTNVSKILRRLCETGTLSVGRDSPRSRVYDLTVIPADLKARK